MLYLLMSVAVHIKQYAGTFYPIGCAKYTRTYLPIFVVENVETQSNETATYEWIRKGIPLLLECSTKPTNLSFFFVIIYLTNRLSEIFTDRNDF